MQAKALRDKIVHDLKKECSGLTAAEINGNFFAAADIVMPKESCDGYKSYRIVVIPRHIDKEYLDRIKLILDGISFS